MTANTSNNQTFSATKILNFRTAAIKNCNTQEEHFFKSNYGWLTQYNLSSYIDDVLYSGIFKKNEFETTPAYLNNIKHNVENRYKKSAPIIICYKTILAKKYLADKGYWNITFQFSQLSKIEYFDIIKRKGIYMDENSEFPSVVMGEYNYIYAQSIFENGNSENTEYGLYFDTRDFIRKSNTLHFKMDANSYSSTMKSRIKMPIKEAKEFASHRLYLIYTLAVNPTVLGIHFESNPNEWVGGYFFEAYTSRKSLIKSNLNKLFIYDATAEKIISSNAY